MQILANILPWIQIMLAVILGISILLQKSATGVGGALGGSETGGISHTKRGFEKFLFEFTIVVAILFVVSAFLAVLI